jgi:hypothetical protein
VSGYELRDECRNYVMVEAKKPKEPAPLVRELAIMERVFFSSSIVEEIKVPSVFYTGSYLMV